HEQTVGGLLRIVAHIVTDDEFGNDQIRPCGDNHHVKDEEIVVFVGLKDVVERIDQGINTEVAGLRIDDVEGKYRLLPGPQIVNLLRQCVEARDNQVKRIRVRRDHEGAN